MHVVTAAGGFSSIVATVRRALRVILSATGFVPTPEQR